MYHITATALSFTLLSCVLAEPVRNQNTHFLRRSSLISSKRGADTCAAKSSTYEAYPNFIHRYHTSGCVTGQATDWWYKLCCVPFAADQNSTSLAWCSSGPPLPSTSPAPISTPAPYVAPEPTSVWVAPTPAPYVAPYSAPYVAPAPVQVQSGNKVYSGGQATYFYQNGVAGACGTVHGDWEYIAALQTEMYANGANCGKSIVLTNNAGVSVTAIVGDMCPTCNGVEYVDLSEGAFLQIATKDQGMIPMTWHFL